MKSKTRIVKRPTNAIRRLDKLGKAMAGPNRVAVGLPRGSNAYPDGTSVIEIGAKHEFGSPGEGVPQRSFLRATMNDKRRSYASLTKTLTRRVVSGKITKREALATLGLTAQNDVQGRISDGIEPELRYREGTPLILTGHLRQSITFEVVE